MQKYTLKVGCPLIVMDADGSWRETVAKKEFDAFMYPGGDAYAELLVLMYDKRPICANRAKAGELCVREVKRNRCTHCHGTGIFKLGGQSKGTCFQCKGKGFQNTSDERRNEAYSGWRLVKEINGERAVAAQYSDPHRMY